MAHKVTREIVLAHKTTIIYNICSRADESNKGWMMRYLNENFTDIVDSIARGNTLKHGFRGLEVESEIHSLTIEGEQ